MSVPAAVGWTFGITFAFILLNTVIGAVRPGSTYDLVTQVGCQAIAYLLGLFLILRVHAPEASIRDLLGLRGTHLAFYPLAVLLGVLVEVPADGLYDALVKRFPIREPDHFLDLYREASAPRRALFALFIVAVGPALEEILFRGALFRLLRRAHPADLVIGVTALLFAVAHLEWQMFLPIGIVGVALAFLRHTSGSIVPSFLLHGSFNAMSFALMARARPGAEGTAFPPVYVGAAAALALALVGLVHLLGRSAAASAARARDLR
jgi:hypothetical protein